MPKPFLSREVARSLGQSHAGALKVIELLRSSTTDHCCLVAAPVVVPSDSALPLAFGRDELNAALVCPRGVPVLEKEVAPGICWSSVGASAAGPGAGGLAWPLLRLLVRTCKLSPR